MLDIGWPELLVVAIVLVVVVGPKDLPRMLRTFGRTTSKMRSMAGDFRKQFDEALKEAELDDVKSIVDDARSLNPKTAIRRELSSLNKIGREMESDLRTATTTKPSDAKPATPVKGSGASDGEAPAPAQTAPIEGQSAPAASASKADPAEEGRT
ncbi:Sec-independent protein translocase protein TatB [Notoacmeibacter ruber]|uniref:Sec-independent protein translocase protein TatB n=1 Tax=Notoacmeibacter ruber TaxID=2670375 RepID=A0A3L7JHP0_9HYPH|nr:Sec-independent protein translocase protein TatB [Notoacmeibacter ruber]RLQ88012.1 twin-arginine translocase subunit TatB [Notoacmeibacter ruber]